MEATKEQGEIVDAEVAEASTEIAPAETVTASVPAKRETFSLAPKDLSEAIKFAELIAESDLAPKDFKEKPGNVLVAVQMGAEVGLAPMQAIQNVAVINGRPSMWGDAVLAVVRASGALEAIHEEDDGQTAVCVVKRKGEAQVERSFSMDDARQAGLDDKAGPWTQYPKRMRQMRARAFALRDVFPDVLKGIHIREEAQDYEFDVSLEGQGTPSEPTVLTPKRRSERTSRQSEAQAAEGGAQTPDESGPDQQTGHPAGSHLVEKIDSKSGTNKDTGKDWTLYRITVKGGDQFTTFDEEQVALAREALEFDRPVFVEWAKKGQYRNLKSIRFADGER